MAREHYANAFILFGVFIIMRVTAQAKAETEHRIVATAGRLFLVKGYERTTIRDIAAEAGIGLGTMFNYFANKDALAIRIITEALDAANAEFRAAEPGDTLSECLFAHVLAGLERLAPARSYLGEVIEKALSPFARNTPDSPGWRIRAGQLDMVREIVERFEPDAEFSYITMHLYWTLYLGVLAFWAGDDSPGQEETLVVVDQAMRLFARALA